MGEQYSFSFPASIAFRFIDVFFLWALPRNAAPVPIFDQVINCWEKVSGGVVGVVGKITSNPSNKYQRLVVAEVVTSVLSKQQSANN
jgi:hypothetical protein